MNKYIIFLLLVLVILPVVSSAESKFKQSTQFNISLQCEFNDTQCSTAGLCNVTFFDPDGEKIIDGLNLSVDSNSFVVVEINSSQSSNIGEHELKFFCFDSGFASSGTKDILITPSGTELSTSGGLVYIIILLILLFIFLLCLSGAILIPFNNPSRETDGKIIGVNQLKYVKILLWVASYLLLIGLSFISWGVTLNFLFLDALSSFFKVIFWVLIAGLLPLFIVTLFTFVTNFVTDKNIHRALSRGLPLR